MFNIHWIIYYISYLLSVAYRGIILSAVLLQCLLHTTLATEILLQKSLNIWSSISFRKRDWPVDFEVVATSSDEISDQKTKNNDLVKFLRQNTNSFSNNVYHTKDIALQNQRLSEKRAVVILLKGKVKSVRIVSKSDWDKKFVSFYIWDWIVLLLLILNVILK